jgi:hypothetical protein
LPDHGAPVMASGGVAGHSSTAALAIGSSVGFSHRLPPAPTGSPWSGPSSLRTERRKLQRKGKKPSFVFHDIWALGNVTIYGVIKGFRSEFLIRLFAWI